MTTSIVKANPIQRRRRSARVARRGKRKAAAKGKTMMRTRTRERSAQSQRNLARNLNPKWDVKERRVQT